MTPEEVTITQRLAEAFTPTRPISLPDLLSGRMDLLRRLIFDIYTPSQHVLLYGDRGVGKTSIARVLAVLAQDEVDENGMRSIIVSCASNDTYGSIWRKVFQEILLAERQLGFEGHERRRIVGRFDPERSINAPNDVRLLLQQLPNPTTVIIDEFDRVRSSQARVLMTDTIKLFSDSETPCSIVLVGVGQSIEQLIAAHQSISRNIDYVQVATLEPNELAQIVERGMRHADLTFDPGLDEEIARLSQGYPHYTHLLGQSVGGMVARRQSRHAVLNDLDEAIPMSIERAASGIRLEYDRATDSTQPNNLFKEVLLACAIVEKDARGRFPSVALQELLQSILGRPAVPPSTYQRHLALFCEQERGRVLIRTGRPKYYRWHFSNPQLIPFILLQSINDGLIDGWAGQMALPIND